MGGKGRLLIIVLSFLFVISSVYAFSGNGSGTSADPYNLTSCPQLNETRYNLSSSWQLINNIDCSATSTWDGGLGFLPIGDDINTFQGNFNGSGYNITNLYINRNSTYYVGLFGYAQNAVINNMGIAGANVSGYRGVGGLVGYAYSSTISNSYSTGTISGTVPGSDNVGGLVGYADTSTNIFNSYSTGTVFGDDGIGGLVGYAYSSTISNSYSTGAVTGDSLVGGLVGYIESSTISNSYSTGTISGTGVFSTGDYVGGLTGHALYSTISNSYSTGIVSSIGSYVGGLVGYAFTSTQISNSYSTGSVSGYDKVGGLVGFNASSSCSNSFWDNQTSNQTTSACGTPKTTSEMKTTSTFIDAGWNFITIWGWNSSVNSAYPFLRWQGFGVSHIAPTYNSSQVEITDINFSQDSYNDTINLSKIFYDIDMEDMNFTFDVNDTTNIIITINNNTDFINVTATASWYGDAFINFTAYDSSVSVNKTVNVTLGGTSIGSDLGGSNYVAQAFLVNNSGNITYISLQFQKNTPPNPKNNITVEIRNYDNGLPGSSILANGTLLASSLTADVCTTVNFTLENKTSVTANSRYIVYAKSPTSHSQAYSGCTDSVLGAKEEMLLFSTDSGATWSNYTSVGRNRTMLVQIYTSDYPDRGTAISTNFDVGVLSSNNPPAYNSSQTAITDFNFSEDLWNDTGNLSKIFTDESSQLNFSYIVNDSTHFNVIINNATGIINISSKVGNWSGDGLINISAYDGELWSDNSTQFDIGVLAVNDAPSYNTTQTMITDINMSEDTVNNTVDLTPTTGNVFYDTENNAFTKFEYGINDTTHFTVSINNGTGIVTVTPAANWSGDAKINFSAYDGALWTTANSTNFDIGVIAVNDAPFFNFSQVEAFNFTMNEDTANSTVNLSKIFADIDSNDLNYSFFVNTTVLDSWNWNSSAGPQIITSGNTNNYEVFWLNQNASINKISFHSQSVNTNRNITWNITRNDTNENIAWGLKQDVINEENFVDLNSTVLLQENIVYRLIPNPINAFSWSQSGYDLITNGYRFATTPQLNDFYFRIFNKENFIVSINQLTDKINISATANWSGTGTINFSAWDGLRNSYNYSINFNISVIPVNDAPDINRTNLTLMSNWTHYQNLTRYLNYSLFANITDLEGNNIKYVNFTLHYPNGTAEIFNKNGTQQGTTEIWNSSSFNLSEGGVYIVKINASDVNNGRTNIEWNFTYIASNLQIWRWNITETGLGLFANLSVNVTVNAPITWCNYTFLYPNGSYIMNNSIGNNTIKKYDYEEWTHSIQLQKNGTYSGNVTCLSEDGFSHSWNLITFTVDDTWLWSPQTYLEALQAAGDHIIFNISFKPSSTAGFYYDFNITTFPFNDTAYNISLNHTYNTTQYNFTNLSTWSIPINISTSSGIANGTYLINITIFRLNNTFKRNETIEIVLGAHPPSGNIVILNATEGEPCNLNYCDKSGNILPGEPWEVTWYLNNTGGNILTECKASLDNTLTGTSYSFSPSNFTIDNESTSTTQFSISLNAMAKGFFFGYVNLTCKANGFGDYDSILPEQRPFLSVYSPMGSTPYTEKYPFVPTGGIPPIEAPQLEIKAEEFIVGDGNCTRKLGENYYNSPKDCPFDFDALISGEIYKQDWFLKLLFGLVFVASMIFLVSQKEENIKIKQKKKKEPYKRIKEQEVGWE